MSMDGTVLERADARRGGSRPGVAAMRVSASGHASLSELAMDILGWPQIVLIAARDGAVIIKAATPDDHRAYRLVWYVAPNGRRGNSRFAARAAFIAAGMLPETGSTKYLALECTGDDGRPAIFMRADVTVPVRLHRKLQAVPA